MIRFGDFLIRLLRRFSWLLAACLIVLALYVSLGRQLVPLLAGYRELVQQKAQELLRTPVAIGRLEGRWNGLAPHLIAHDIQIGEGDEVLRLSRVEVIPDIFDSLWRRQLSLYSLDFQSLSLVLEENEQGRWHLQGLSLQDDQPVPEPPAILSALQRIRRLMLHDGALTLQPFGGPAQTLGGIDLELHSTGHDMRLDGRATLPDGQSLALNLQGQVVPEGWRDAELKAYFRLPQSDWAKWLPKRLSGDWPVERLQGGAELWVDWHRQGVEDAVVRLDIPQLAIAHGKQKPLPFEDIGATLYVRRREGNYRLLLDDLTFTNGATRWGDTRIGIEQLASDDDTRPARWRLRSDHLDIGPLVAPVQALAPLSETQAALIRDLRPSGSLHNLELTYDPAGPAAKRLSYAANLERVSFSEHGGIPAAGNVSGSIEGDLGAGELRIDSEDFSLHLARFFAAPWHYRKAGGRLGWTIDGDTVSLIAPYLLLEGEEGRIAGDFLIRLYHDPAREDYMDLRVGMSKGDARFTSRYLPTRSPGMSKELSTWLTRAIKSGSIEAGYFQYQGSLESYSGPAGHTTSLYFDVRNVELDYQAGWPALQQANAEILVEGNGTLVRLSEGHILGSRVHDATAFVAHGEGNQEPRLSFKGKVDSSLADGLRILREAPLGVAETFAGWQGEGALSATLDLDIPFGDKLEPRVIVDFSSRNARLKLAKPDLQLDRLTGDFRYDSNKGLSAKSLQAQVLGQSVRGRMLALGKPGKPITRIDAQGRVSLKRLTQWLSITQPLPATGMLPYQLRLTLDGDNSQLQMDTSLQGVAVDLPAPFGKSSQIRRDTTLTMSLQGAERRYWLHHATLASASFVAPEGNWQQGRGEVYLGDRRAKLPSSRGLRIRGTLATLDWNEWQKLVERYSGPAKTQAWNQEQAVSLLKNARVHIGRFKGFGTQIDDLHVGLKRQGQAWQLKLDSDTIRGHVRRPDASTAPLVAAVDYLRLPAGSTGKAGLADTDDPLVNIDPRNFPAMDIAIKQVLLGADSFGSWALKFRPVPDGVEFRDIDFNLRGLDIDGQAGWKNGRSWYRGRLQGDNLADVMKAWGVTPSVTSERFYMDVDGNWPGSPAWFAGERFSGTLKPHLRKGQFIEVDGSAQALRVFGLLNFNAIGRRLRLDFSDLFDKGLSYDRVDGTLVARNGFYSTREPVILKGPSSNLELSGTLDMPADQVDACLLVTLPLTTNLPLAALIVGAPMVGGALWIADQLVGDKISRFASVQYRVKGSWESPDISFDKPFEKSN
ncbi:YhdP family protein [Azomonas macrocytogenes]|uniref:Uncharacterized protein (TIGR02099 family) n=1 Tax=Azomonas macrocytogenes TaxID=69962 RepID=A0A839T776_AZOMA|nr:YhdP family protein [Azomonas macrocytogenes]MBB3104700.1 uncharacterized protein (TIGR02099 family) [Azomonas macrocytogenes]